MYKFTLLALGLLLGAPAIAQAHPHEQPYPLCAEQIPFESHFAYVPIPNPEYSDKIYHEVAALRAQYDEYHESKQTYCRLANQNKPVVAFWSFRKRAHRWALIVHLRKFTLLQVVSTDGV